MSDEPKNSEQDQEDFDRPIREKLAEGWLEFREQFLIWLQPILSDKKMLVTVIAVIVIGIFALIRGIYKTLI